MFFELGTKTRIRLLCFFEQNDHLAAPNLATFPKILDPNLHLNKFDTIQTFPFNAYLVQSSLVWLESSLVKPSLVWASLVKSGGPCLTAPPY